MSQQPVCFHCGEPIADSVAIFACVGGDSKPVCCVGCRAVAEFIDASRLGAFYRFRSQPDPSLELRPQAAEWAHYDSDDLLTKYVYRNHDVGEVTLEIGGMYCSACVWLLENALKRHDGLSALDISPATRRAVIRWDLSRLRFSELLAAIGRLGFRPRPLGVGQSMDLVETEYKSALKRLIVAAAAGMQVMMFAVALYAGAHFGIDRDIEKFLRIISLLVTVPIVFYSARPFFVAAWRGLRARAPGMDLPVALAITAAFIASVRATWLDQGEIYCDSVAMFVLFLSATRYLEMKTRHRSDSFAIALARLLPDTAERMTDGKHTTVAVDRLRVNDVILVRSGDVIPADGEVSQGNLSVDESIISGESLPVSRGAGTAVLAGSINRGGSAQVRVTRTGAGTNLAEISRMLERAKADRPPIAVLADRIASRFVVGVLLVAALAGSIWLLLDPARAFEVMLATLVVTCPCALSLATPAALAAAASNLAGRGFLLVRSRLLEAMSKATIVVFDKTGTLTAGKPEIRQLEVLTAGISEADCLAIAAAIELASEHVLARAFAEKLVPGKFAPTELRIDAGKGVQACIDGDRWRIGSADYVSELLGGGVPAGSTASDTTVVWLGNDKQLVARFEIGDALRADAVAAVDALISAGFRIMIASGDREPAVRGIAQRLGVSEWRALLSPEAKVALIKALRDRGEIVVMVGDGINDAPVLAAADASIALDAGTALARASADAVVLGKRMGSVVEAAAVARMTRRVIRQNILWAIFYNLMAVPLAISGILEPWMAALGMSVSSLVVVLNALRLRRRSGNTALSHSVAVPKACSLPAAT
jgi:Cu2+-exporting ATPase